MAVGTPKRERQKANRALGQQQAQQAQSRARFTRIGIVIVGSIVAVIALVFVVGLFTGDDSDDEPAADAPVEGEAPTEEGDAAATTEVPETTEAPVLTEPENVEIPVVEQNPDEVVPDGCPPIEGAEEQTQQFDEAPPFCLDPEIAYTAVITTNLGTIEVDLDQQAAPNTVNSFVFLARNNYFNDTVCHRIIQEFVVQCGDPTATGTGGPGYSTADELPEAGSYEVGSIAMANSGPDTQGSQFFIITGDQGVALPPAYSLFGQVGDSGLGIVSEMNARGSLDGGGTPISEVRLIDVQIATA